MDKVYKLKNTILGKYWNGKRFTSVGKVYLNLTNIKLAVKQFSEDTQKEVLKVEVYNVVFDSYVEASKINEL